MNPSNHPPLSRCSIASRSTSIHWRPGTSSRPRRSRPHGVTVMYWLSSQMTKPNGPRGDGACSSTISPSTPSAQYIANVFVSECLLILTPTTPPHQHLNKVCALCTHNFGTDNLVTPPSTMLGPTTPTIAMPGEHGLIKSEIRWIRQSQHVKRMRVYIMHHLK